MRYLLADHLGSTSIVTNETGAVVDQQGYDAWGDRRVATGTSAGADDPTNIIRPTSTSRGFTGHEQLDQGRLGLVHMNARIYDPTLGRFISGDPTVPKVYNSQTLNRYSYVLNSPLDATDPTGYRPLTYTGDVTFGFLEKPDLAHAANGDSGYPIPLTTTIGQPVQAADSANKVNGDSGISTVVVSGKRLYPAITMSSYYDFSSYITAITLQPAKKTTTQVIHETRVQNYRHVILRPLSSGRVESQVPDLLLLLMGIPGEGELTSLAMTRVASGFEVDGLIYRSASGTAQSMTPRLIDINGLSAATTLESKALSGKIQIIDTSRLKDLCAVCDNPVTGHVSIFPRDMGSMPGWIKSRGGSEIHPLTQELMNAIVGSTRKP